MLFTGCVGIKYLKEDEKLLFKQRIEGNKNLDKEALSQLYVQTPNRRIPKLNVSPYFPFYYHGLKRYDEEKYTNNKNEIIAQYDEKIAATPEKKKNKIARYKRNKTRKVEKENKKITEGNVWMRWGEPITVYDSAKISLTKERITLYLNAKGYFKAKVDTIIQIGKKRKPLYNNNGILRNHAKKVWVTYDITKGPAYIIDTVFIQTGDTAISRLLSKYEGESLLKPGENYTQTALTQERERIDLLMKDNGYFNFSRQYIDFDVDTAYRGSGRIGIKTTINKPLKKDYHRVYRVDSINFTTDANQAIIPDSLRRSSLYKGVHYRYFNDEYSKKILNRRIFIRKDSLYSRANTYDTQRQLANLDNFKFININYDTLGGLLVANIFTSPLSRYQLSNEVGINVTQGFPGPFYNMSFKKRNIFHGLENFEINGRIGIEGVAPVTGKEVYSSVEAGINASLTFPQFILPLTGRVKEHLGYLNPKTRLLMGYSYTDRPEYLRKNLNFSNTYTWQKQDKALYSFTATDASIIRSQLSNDFKTTLEELEADGNKLINTFKPSFVSSMTLSATWNFNSYGLNYTNSSFFRMFIESGGTSLNILNTDYLEKEALEFYKYIKLNVDYRKVHPINQNTTLAYRINTGIANPYSKNNILPYEKYFFAGGSNGIRAWRPRRLGPGSYARVDTTNRVSYDFEQQGEVLFEGSVELRKNLIGFIDYAFFLDFGNIWTIKEDLSRPGAQFKLDSFYKEIAIGSGLGIRFDFSFLILRLDAGVKVYDPARAEGKRFIFSSGHNDAPFTPSTAEPLVFNIGIGYPF